MTVEFIRGWLRFAAFFFVAVSATLAVPIERELGSGLLYLRVHSLPGDLPPKPTGRVPPCIVDLRYVRADESAAAAFSEWLRARATTRAPVFVLANADTALPLLKVLAGHERGRGIVVVGIKRAPFHPDIEVMGTAENERRAYDALEEGADIKSLLTDNPDKARNDEASLSKDRLAEASADATGKKTSPPIDATLQRAMHLHRALVALKKI